MTKRRIGVVDYGIGNHASIISCLKTIGFHIVISSDKSVLDETDLLVLPGVGAFPTAMKALNDKDLVRYLRHEAEKSKPIVGICLGMQLLTDSSDEVSFCEGLGLIPGTITAFPESACHVGWNSLKALSELDCFKKSDGKDFYFNHSYYYEGPSIYKTCLTRFHANYASVIRKDKVVGIQFHPEKSQDSGRTFLRDVLLELLYA